MSKTKKKIEKQPLSPNTIRTIIISAICVVMIAVLAVSLVLVLKKPVTPPDDTDTPNNGSSSLYIKNGDFAYFDKENTSFPKTADNWTLYTYKDPISDTEHGFEAITSADKVLSGIIDTHKDAWETVQKDLADSGISNVTNPGIHDEDLDTNVFMFATRQATTAMIMSQSFSIASQTSAKISVWLNTSLLTEGSKVVISLQKYSSTKPSALEKDRYSYNVEIGKAEGWKEYELYVFNRDTGSKSIVCTVGLGNCYNGTAAEGILFVDDIAYETISANEYRKVAENESTPTNYSIIGEDEEIPASKYSELKTYFDASAQWVSLKEYLNEAVVDGEAYSPFTIHDNFYIYKATNNGTERGTVAMVLDRWNGQPIVVKSSEDKSDHLHIRFWVRVAQNNVTAQGNIMLQSLVSGKWEDIDSGSFTSIVTNQDIAEDNNCGWTKYDIYLKPTSAADTTVRVVFALGNVNGYSTDGKYIPNGTLYVTAPFVENVTATDYSSASSGSYTKKVSLMGDTASTTVTNGSFSNITTSNPTQPSSWTPVFAGYNSIYKDGKGNTQIEGLPMGQTDASGMVVKNNAENNAPAFDDSEQNVLKITNSTATAYGYLSTDITLSAHTVYAFSVLAKADSAAPFVYVVKNGAETREKAILGKIEKSANSNLVDDEKFGMIDSSEEGNGWTRYYIVIATGDETETVRVALFNGSIDGTTKQAGTVYYDYVAMSTIGSYTIDDKKYEEGNKDAPATLRDRIKFTPATGYTVFEKLTAEEITKLGESSNVSISEPDWDKMVEKALEEKPEEPDPIDKNTKSPVNVALLLSVISSIALIGALLIVVVIRIFKKRNQQ